MQQVCNNKFKIKGGGTFGYTWTEGYGITGKKYSLLGVSFANNEI